MSGLIARLREGGKCEAGCHPHVCACSLCDDAADALEANEKEIKRLGMLVGDTIADHPYVVELMRQLKKQDAEIAQLEREHAVALVASARARDYRTTLEEIAINVRKALEGKP
jgi:hypothetical protein